MTSLVRDVMTSEVVTVEPWTPFRETVTQLAQHRISAAPVVDSEGNVLGVVTEADLPLSRSTPTSSPTSPWPGTGAAAWSARRPPRSSPAR
jgi:CBS-domain-containing membrane protein